jgi:hypothetical protein
MKFKALRPGFILSKNALGEEGCFVVFSGTVLFRSKHVSITRQLKKLDCCGELPFLDPSLESPTAFTPDIPSPTSGSEAVAEVVFIPRVAFDHFIAPIASQRLAERIFVLRQLHFFCDLPDSDYLWRQRQQRAIGNKEGAEGRAGTTALKGWGKQRLAELNAVLEPRRMRKGEVLQQQGEKSTEMIFVWSGECVVQRTVKVSECNSWPVVQYEHASGTAMLNRTSGFPYDSTAFAKEAKVEVRRVGPGDFFGDSCLECFVEKFDTARKQQHARQRAQQLETIENRQQRAKTRTMSSSSGSNRNKEKPQDDKQGGGDDKQGGGGDNVLARWAACSISTVATTTNTTTTTATTTHTAGGMSSTSPAVLAAVSPTLPPRNKVDEEDGDSELDFDAGDFDGGFLMLEPHTVVCESDGEVLVLSEAMFPYLLHRDNRPLVEYLTRRHAALPADSKIASLVRVDERKRKTKQAVNASEKEDRTRIAAFWPGATKGC